MICIKHDVKIVKGANRIALYDLETGQVYGLNKSGAMIIDLISKGQNVAEIIENISCATNEGNDQVAVFVEEFTKQLVDLGLLSKELPNCESCHTDSPITSFILKEVWCEITSACNHRCIHCYAADPIKSIDMDTDSWIQVIRQIGKIGCAHLQFTGGEPFLRKDIWRLVKAALNNNIEVEIYSNLTVCKESDLTKCKKHRVAIATTILGLDATVHDSITQIPGSFSRTVQAIKRLVELGCKIRVNVIIMQQNQHCIEETLEFIKALGVNQVGTDYMRPVGQGAVNQHYAVEEWNKRHSLDTSVLDFYYNHSFNPCWGHKLAIKPDGTVLPCVLARDIILGNVRNESIHTIINSDKTKELWGITLDKVEICQDCEFKYACHDCRVLALYQGGGLYHRTTRCSYNPYTGIWPDSS